MHAISESTHFIPLVSGTDVIGELAKFAAKTGYGLVLGPDLDHEGFHSVTLTRPEHLDLADELAYLVFLQAHVSNLSPQAVLDATRGKLERMRTTMNLPPLDTRGIGGGAVE